MIHMAYLEQFIKKVDKKHYAFEYLQPIYLMHAEQKAA